MSGDDGNADHKPMAASLELERRLLAWLGEHGKGDAAHDLGHLRRVLGAARAICREEGGCDPEVLTAAALLHDVVHVPKDSPLRSQASRMAADRARELLRGMGMPEHRLDAVAHAIHAHSFSARIEPTTLEARAVQDADRLDALGSIGIARCFATGGSLGRPMFEPGDPLALRRPVDDSAWGVDHFRAKLLGLPSAMRTAAGRRMALGRLRTMLDFLARLSVEADGGDLHDFETERDLGAMLRKEDVQCPGALRKLAEGVFERDHEAWGIAVMGMAESPAATLAPYAAFARQHGAAALFRLSLDMHDGLAKALGSERALAMSRSLPVTPEDLVLVLLAPAGVARHVARALGQRLEEDRRLGLLVGMRPIA